MANFLSWISVFTQVGPLPYELSPVSGQKDNENLLQIASILELKSLEIEDLLKDRFALFLLG